MEGFERNLELQSSQDIYSQTSTTLSTQNAWIYFGITFGISWICWFAAVLYGKDDTTIPTMILHYIGGAAPFIAALIIVFSTYPRSIRKEYFDRAINPTRINLKWWILMISIVTGVTGIAVGLYIIIFGTYQLENISIYQAQTMGLLFTFLFLFIFGPFPEELGWRGIAQPELEKRYNSILTSLIVGCFWSIWHLPLFFISGTYQYEMGIVSWKAVFFFLQMPIFSIIMGYVFDETKQSTLSAIMMHYMNNLLGELLEPPLIAEIFRTGLYLIIMILIIWQYYKKKSKR